MSFTKLFPLHLCHIYIINTNTVIHCQIDLDFHCFYLEITWKIHGILCHQRSGNLYRLQGICMAANQVERVWLTVKSKRIIENVHYFRLVKILTNFQSLCWSANFSNLLPSYNMYLRKCSKTYQIMTVHMDTLSVLRTNIFNQNFDPVSADWVPQHIAITTCTNHMTMTTSGQI